MAAPEIPAPNAGQIAFWNGEAGEKWVRHQAVQDAMLAPATALLLELADIRPGESVLDVGCGTGATLLALAPLAGRRGRVVGCDVSAPMLAHARRRLDAAGLGSVALLQADAQTYPFPGEAFDALVSRFGVMFFEDPVAAFANLAAALRRGGRVAFVCWAALADNPLFAVPLRAAVRRLGPPEPVPPRAPGPLAFSEPDYVREILAAAGFAEIAIEERWPPLEGLPTAEAQADLVCDMGPVSRLVAARQADAATAAAIRAEVVEALAPYLVEGRVRIPARLWYVRARRPG